jgi:hypothetical protein
MVRGKMNKTDAKILFKNGAKNWSKNDVYKLSKSGV